MYYSTVLYCTDCTVRPRLGLEVAWRSRVFQSLRFQSARQGQVATAHTFLVRPPTLTQSDPIQPNSTAQYGTVASAFLFVVTVEGLEVWTFPSDNNLHKQLTDNLPDGQEEGIFGGGGGVGPPLLSRTPAAEPSARPCLLHVQRLEVSGQWTGVSGPGLGGDVVLTMYAAYSS